MVFPFYTAPPDIWLALIKIWFIEARHQPHLVILVDEVIGKLHGSMFCPSGS